MMVSSTEVQNPWSALAERFFSGDPLSAVLPIMFYSFLFLLIPVVIHLYRKNMRGAFEAFGGAVMGSFALILPIFGWLITICIFWGSLRIALFSEESESE